MRSKILPWIAIVLSAAALLMSILNIDRFDVDPQSLIGWAIAILALLVTILIGWQIYSMLNVKDEIREIKSNVDSALLKVNLECGRLSTAIYSTLFNEIRKKEEDVAGYFHYGLLVVLHAQSIGNIGLCRTMIKALMESFPTSTPIRNQEKANILNLAGRISETPLHLDFKDLHGKLIVELKSED